MPEIFYCIRYAAETQFERNFTKVHSTYFNWCYTNFISHHCVQGIEIKEKQDRSRRCLYIQSIDIFFYFLTFFAPLTGNEASNRLNIIIFAISRSISIKIDTSLALFQKKKKLAAILIFFQKRGSPYWRKLPTDLADFK